MTQRLWRQRSWWAALIGWRSHYFSILVPIIVQLCLLYFGNNIHEDFLFLWQANIFIQEKATWTVHRVDMLSHLATATSAGRQIKFKSRNHDCLFVKKLLTLAVLRCVSMLETRRSLNSSQSALVRSLLHLGCCNSDHLRDSRITTCSSRQSRRPRPLLPLQVSTAKQSPTLHVGTEEL